MCAKVSVELTDRQRRPQGANTIHKCGQGLQLMDDRKNHFESLNVKFANNVFKCFLLSKSKPHNLGGTTREFGIFALKKNFN